MPTPFCLVLVVLTACVTGEGVLTERCPPVRFNEVMTAQHDYPVVTADWFELENLSDEPVDLSGVIFTKGGDRGRRLPDGVEIGVGDAAFLVIEASTPEAASGEYVSVHFDLNAEAETIDLWSPDGTHLCEELRVGVSYDDYTWQRAPAGEPSVEGEWCVAETPSAGAENGACLPGAR